MDTRFVLNFSAFKPQNAALVAKSKQPGGIGGRIAKSRRNLASYDSTVLTNGKKGEF
jgi:hypothetical protein